MRYKSNIEKNTTFKNIFLIFIISLFLLSVVGLLLGSINKFDFELDSIIFDESTHSFSWYFGAFAGYFATIMFAFATVCLITFNPWYKKYQRHWKITYLICAYFAGTVLVMYQAFDGFASQIYEQFSIQSQNPSGTNTTILLAKLGYGALIGGALVVGFSCLNFFYLNKKIFVTKEEVNKVFRWALFAFMSMVLVSFMVWMLKGHLHRERYFQLVDTTSGTGSGINNFKPWYSLLWDMNVDDGEIKTKAMTSFPSGHVTWAMSLCTFIPFLNLLKIKDQKIKTITQASVVSFIGIFIITIMLCRLITGRHYLTDVTAAVLINGMVFAGCYYIFNRLPMKGMER